MIRQAVTGLPNAHDRYEPRYASLTLLSLMRSRTVPLSRCSRSPERIPVESSAMRARSVRPAVSEPYLFSARRTSNTWAASLGISPIDTSSTKSSFGEDTRARAIAKLLLSAGKSVRILSASLLSTGKSSYMPSSSFKGGLFAVYAHLQIFEYGKLREASCPFGTILMPRRARCVRAYV